MKRDEAIAVLRSHLDELRRLHVRSLALFGSVARDEADADSDVDLVVEFDATPALHGFLELKRRLESLLGRPVDLVTRASIPERKRARVEAEPRLYFEDALAAAEETLALTRGLDAAGFVANRAVYLAVERTLFVVGEALARVPPETRAEHPEIA